MPSAVIGRFYPAYFQSAHSKFGSYDPVDPKIHFRHILGLNTHDTRNPRTSVNSSPMARMAPPRWLLVALAISLQRASALFGASWRSHLVTHSRVYRMTEPDSTTDAMAAALEQLSSRSSAVRPERATSRVRSSFSRKRGASERVARSSKPKSRPSATERKGGQPIALRRGVVQQGQHHGTRELGSKPDTQLDERGGWVQGDDWVESTSFPGQLMTLAPTRLMLFIDGSWLYYSM